MTTGVVSAQRQALIRLEVSDDSGHTISVQGILDTGFTGYLTLPAANIARLRLPFQGFRRAVLADGTIVKMDAFKAMTVWDGQSREIQVFAAEGGPLIGMAMLYGHDVNIRVVDGGDVTIKRLP